MNTAIGPAASPPRITSGDLDTRLVAAVTHGRTGLDPLVVRASTNLKRAATVLDQREVRAVHHPAGWTSAAFRTLVMIHGFGPIEAKDVARLVGVSRQAVSGVLATLERDGLIQRGRASRADRRLAPATVTEKGCAAVDAMLIPQHRVQAGFFAALDPGELRTLLDLLRRLAQATG